MLLTGNDIGPTNTLEVGFLSLALVGGALINANLFGELVELAQTLNQQSKDFEEKLDSINTAMQNLKLSDDLQQKVIKFLKTTHSS